MMGTKIEIQLYKLEPGSWTRLDVPQVNKEIPKDDADKVDEVDDSVENVDALDLDDLDLSAPKLQLSNIASGGRTDQEII